MRILLFLLITIGLVSCMSQKKCAEKYPNIIKESVTTVTEIKYRDSLIYIKGDSVRVVDSIPCDKDTTVVIETPKTKGTVTIKNKKVSVTCETKELEVRLENVIKESTIRETIIKENLTRINLLEDENAILKDNNKSLKSQRNKLGIAILIIVAIFGVGLYLKLKKIF